MGSHGVPSARLTRALGLLLLIRFGFFAGGSGVAFGGGTSAMLWSVALGLA